MANQGVNLSVSNKIFDQDLLLHLDANENTPNTEISPLPINTPKPAQEQPPSHLGYPMSSYTPTPIKPCMSDLISPSPFVFHLLSCGHIVCLPIPLNPLPFPNPTSKQEREANFDSRCGFNCLHASIHSDCRDWGSITNIKNDSLYCETCYGIPLDRYAAPPPSFHSSTHTYTYRELDINS